MNRGDLVRHWDNDWDIIGTNEYGIILNVIGDFPWEYLVLWNSGKIKKHETGVLRRLMIHENR